MGREKLQVVRHPVVVEQRDEGAIQGLWCEEYGKRGTIKGACAAVGISPAVVKRWTEADHLGFREKKAAALQTFADDLEQVMFERIKAQKPGDNPVLLIFALKGAMPGKYRDGYQFPEQEERAKELLGKLRVALKAKRVTTVTMKEEGEIEGTFIDRLAEKLREKEEA